MDTVKWIVPIYLVASVLTVTAHHMTKRVYQKNYQRKMRK